MLPEQQLVPSYFIQEAKAHLNKIEQGLLNLQNTLENTQMVSEVSRAAHSLKRGAALLELDSIQQISQHLEDYFKILQDSPQIQADQKLEFLLWQVFDILKQLIEFLENALLLKNTVDIILSEIKPVFIELKQHLKFLISQAETGVLTAASSPDEVVNNIQLEDIFQSQEKLFNPNISTAINDQAVEFNKLMNEKQIPALDAEVDLSDLFATDLDEDEPLQADSDLSALFNLEENSPENSTSLNEDLGFDSLFNAEPTPIISKTTAEPELFDLFEQPQASQKSLVQEIKSTSSLEDTDLSDLWEELLTQAQAEPELEELWLNADSGESLEELLEIETPNKTEVTAADLDIIAASFKNTEEFDFTVDDLWEEQLNLDAPKADSLSIDFPEGENVNAPSVDEQSALLDLNLDTIETDFFSGSDESDRSLDLFFSDPLTVTSETLSDISLDISSAEAIAIDDQFDDLEAFLEVPAASTVDTSQPALDINEFSDLDALLGEDTLELVTQTPPAQDLGIDVDDLEALLEETTNTSQPALDTDEFSDLDALLDEDTSPQPVAPDLSVDEFDDLEALLEETSNTSQPALDTDEFSDLDALLDADTSIEAVAQGLSVDEFDELEALLEETSNTSQPALDTDEFSDLDALLDADTSTEAFAQTLPTVVDASEKLPQKTDKTSNVPIKLKQAQTKASKPRRVAFEQTMKVPVKHLDNVGNLVGELVVNRNSLEQDQQRLRQSLENLLHQVQQLNGLGSRMQELYERSLMEASLHNIRQGSRSPSVNPANPASEGHATGMDFDALEMDRFTGFHTLSQEMIELIVRVREASSDIEFVTDDTEQVARQFRQVTTQLQEGLTRSRMLPFAQIAERLPRAVRDISLKYGKQAELHIEGQESLIDKVILEQLYDPMTHLVNNSITHGIETPEERLAKGKPPVGKITIKAFHQGNQTVISVSDDGAGIDSDKVMTKAIQKGMISLADAKTMFRLDAYNLLFHAGFSTKEQVDEFAGRGVGMDVVKTSLNEIRGTISTDSTLGKGTTFTIRLPLTLSIGKALCCISDKAQIAFPMDGVEDMIDISPQNIVTNEQGQSCISWRDSLLPFRHLKELLVSNRQIGRSSLYGGSRDDDMISIVVLRSAGAFMAIQVDQVLGEQEIVIKQFEAPAPKPVGVAGATVRGDGRIMPIADVLELIDLATGRLQREGSANSLWTATPVLPTQDVKTEPMVLIVDDSITVRELLSMTFNKAGYRVEQARDGQEAWDKLRDGLPCDLVFCDIEMPRMDGLELLSRMQKDPNLSNLPIAMLTSRGADRHRQMAVQLGARGYFTKPYLEEALLDGAQRMLNGEVLVAASVT